MNPQNYIGQYGGKGGSLFYLRDYRDMEKHILPLYYLPADVSVDEIEDILPQDINDNWIIRATHRNDYDGFVDILKTEKRMAFHPETPKSKILYDMKNDIKKIREHANSPEVHKYSEFEGQAYDGKVGIVIQPFNPGMRGSIVEHPHEKGTYLIDLAEKPLVGDRDILERLVVVGNKIDEGNSTLDVIRGWHEELSGDIISVYNEVKESGFVSPDKSLQMEFGLNRGMFPNNARIICYQARPFLKFEESPYKLSSSFWKEYTAFGITPEEGIILPVVKTYHQQGVNDIGYDFAWLIQNMTCRMNECARPKNMKAFVPLGDRINSLEHNTYKWVKKADVSVLSPIESIRHDKNFVTGDKVRIISNGISHLVEAA